jgi:ParB-like chromosome segregation protein Spo0J
VSEKQQPYLEYMALSELVERYHPRNPREHDLGAIIVSIRQFGYLDPGTIDERSGYFAEGHGRTRALLEMQRQQEDPPRYVEARNGDWYVPVNRGMDFASDDELLAYLVAHNRTTERSGWDNEQLVGILQDLAAADDALFQATGYDGDDVDAMITMLALPEEFPEYDESVADEVSMCTCPKCGHEFPL